MDWQVRDSAATSAPTITGGPTSLSFAERGTPGSECCQEGRLCHPSGLSTPLSPPQAFVATYTATAPEGHTVAWSVEGTDAAKFAISADGALSFKAPPNFDSPGDADGKNTYLVTVTVKATADGNSDTRAVTVTVTDGNDAPSFAQKKTSLEVEEGYAHYLYDDGATDLQGDTITFSLRGEDSEAVTYEHFHIAGKTCYAALNLLHYDSEPDYENPMDADRDGVFSVILQVSDGTSTTRLPITITVTDVDEAPEIEGLPAVKFAENSTAPVGEYTAKDPEGKTSTLVLGGTDAASFTFTNGVLKFKSAPDFETKSSYSVTFTASDGTHDATLDVTVTVTDMEEATRPGRVTGLTATGTHNTVTLNWSAPRYGGPATGYKILRRSLASGEGFQVVSRNTGNTSTTWADSNVSPRTRYAYRVHALGEYGEGVVSPPASVITDHTPLPGRVTGLTASATHDTVTLNWEAPSGGAVVTGYKVLRRALASGGEFQVVSRNTGNTSTTWTDGNVSPRTRYSYRVRALAEYGEGAVSPPASVITDHAPMPGRVTGLKPSATHDTVTLNWEAPGNGGPVTGYKILRRARASEEGFQVVGRTTGNTSTTWTDSNVSPRTRYSYRVRALGEYGEGVVSPPALLITDHAPRPGRVTGLTATSTQDTITLNWAAPGNGGPVTGYKILRRASASENGLNVMVADTGSTGTTWTDSGVSSGTHYFYRVQALGEGGQGQISASVSVSTPE